MVLLSVYAVGLEFAKLRYETIIFNNHTIINHYVLQCPFCHKDSEIADIVDKRFCLENTCTGEKQQLKRDHAYYYQVCTCVYMYDVNTRSLLCTWMYAPPFSFYLHYSCRFKHNCIVVEPSTVTSLCTPIKGFTLRGSC